MAFADNANDTYTETTTVSYGSRISGSFKGMLPGILLFLGAFPLLFWNEGRAVKTARALDEGQGVVIEVESNKTVDPDNDGKLVHMAGKADTKDVLQDATFGISENCIRLERKAEIYQWVEHSETHEKKNVGGSVTKTTTYSYSLEWCDDAVSSTGFKKAGHENPPTGMEFKSEAWQAETVTFGAFQLSERQIERIGDDKTYAIPASFTSRVDRVQVAGNVIYIPEKGTRENALNKRDVMSQTRPGDMRVSYRIVRPHNVSIVAKQRGESFVPFTSKKGDGYKVDLLQDGIRDADEMFETARTGNSILTWFLRILGWFLMYSGLKRFLTPISTLGDVLPLLGDFLEVGIGLVAGVISFACALVTISIAWLFYRPILAIVLLALAGAGVWFLWKKRAALKAKAGAALEKAKEIKASVDAAASSRQK